MVIRQKTVYNPKTLALRGISCIIRRVYAPFPGEPEGMGPAQRKRIRNEEVLL